MMDENNLNQETLCFYPYKFNTILGVYGFLFALLMSVLLSCLMPQTKDKILVICVGVWTMLASCLYLLRAPLQVVCDRQGVSLRNVFTKEQYFAEWDAFVAAYFVRDSRGHIYLLLTRKEMNLDEKKRCFKACTGVCKGKPTLSSEGNVCILLDRYHAEMQSMIQNKFPLLVLKDAIRV